MVRAASRSPAARVLLALLALAAGSGPAPAVAQGAEAVPPPTHEPARTLPGDEVWTRSEAGREALFDLVAGRVEALYWDPDALDWDAWRARHRDAVVGAPDEGAMDAAFRRMFRDLRDDHSRWLGREDDRSPPPVAPAPSVPAPPPADPAPPTRDPGEPPTVTPVETPREAPAESRTAPARLGAETRPLEGRGLLVLRVHPGGAAEAAGLRRGDVISATAAGALTEPGAPSGGGFGMRARLVTALREGPATLTIERPGGPLTVRLEPRPLPAGAEELPVLERTPSLDAARLEIPSFAPGTAAAVHAELDRLAGTGTSALVIDLRGNPGGSVTEMGLVLGAFLEGTPLRSLARDDAAWTLRIERGGSLDVRLVRDAGRLAGRDVAWARLGSFTTWSGDVAVLVDGGTASAAEAFAGALAAAGRAPVVGEPTPGNVETIRRVAFPAGHAAMVAVGDLRTAEGDPLAPVPLDVETRLDPAALARGSDAPYAEAVRRLRGLPLTPGRWF